VTDFDLGFPICVRTTHWFNVLFVTSGSATTSVLDRLYAVDRCG